MTFGSVCSGIEAATVAWEPIGWRCAFVSEIDKFPCALLNHYYPNVPNYGDLNDYERWPQQSIDVLVGGTPCQDFSVAGLRAGMAGSRGGLTMRFLDVVGRYAPAWVVWENVPGVLSIDGGRAFGAFLGGLAKRGYGFAYRVLDAQYSGLAQRRERVFVVGCSGGRWQRAAAVLYDAPRLRWNPPPRREAGKGTAPSISARTQGGGRLGTDAECDGALIAGTLSAANGKQRGAGIQPECLTVTPPCTGNPYGDHESREGLLIAHSLTAEGHDASEDGTGRGVPLVVGAASAKWSKGCGGPAGDEAQNLIAFSCKDNWRDARENLSPTLRSMNHSGSHANAGGQMALAFTERTRADGRNFESQEDLAYAVTNPGSGGRTHSRQIAHGMAVRRLTPREVERLFGFADDYTLIPYRGKPACDGPRYRALGNSMAVPVIRWIGRRIELVESLSKCPSS